MSSNEVPSSAILVPNEPVSVAHLTDVERIRMHCFSDLASTPEELRKVILQLGQRQLQDRFRRVYQRATWSNNNTWLRRRLLEATGFQAPKQAARNHSSTGSRSRGAGGAHKPRQRLHGQAGDSIAPHGIVAVRRTARPPKPKVMPDEVVFGLSGGRYGSANRPASAPRIGSRSAIRSAPRPIPSALQYSQPGDGSRDSYQSLSRQSLDVPPLHRHSGFSDEEYTEHDDGGVLISTNSAFDGIDSLAYGRHGGDSDKETCSEAEDGYDARSQPTSLISTEESFDYSNFAGQLGGTVHFDGRLVRVVSRGLGSTSLSSRGASSLSPLPAQQSQYFPSGTASIPMHSPLTWRPASAPDSSTGTPYSPLHHFPRTKGGWIQGQQHLMEGHSQRLSLNSTSAAGDVNADLWRAMAAEDATRLGQGIGNIRISESPQLASKKRSVATGWESSGWPATPGSAGGKRKSTELGREYEREGGNTVDSNEGDGGLTPLRKLRTMTPKKAHASIVGFGQTGGSASTSAGGSNYYANNPGVNLRERAAPLSLEAPFACAEVAAALQWKMNALDEMMQCVTASEQRMLDISSMSVA